MKTFIDSSLTHNLDPNIPLSAPIIKINKHNLLPCFQRDNINRIKSLLTSRNLAVDNRIRNYLKRYDNQVSIDLLDTLAILSANLIKNELPQESPDPALWFGWHSE